jgi:hypothetical protein
MIKRKGITVTAGQIWTIGKSMINLVKKNHNVDISNEVEILDTFVGDGLINVRDTKTGFRFDIGINNLGKLVR